MELDVDKDVRIIVNFGSKLRYTFKRNDLVARKFYGSSFKARRLGLWNLDEATEFVAVHRALFFEWDKDEYAAEMTLKRWATLTCLKHENVVPYERICVGMLVGTNNATVDFVMDYCDETDLDIVTREILENGKGLHIRAALDISKQLANGLAYLHKNNIIHGTLAPGKAIIVNHNRVKISGLNERAASTTTIADCLEVHAFYDSPRFVAPETIKKAFGEVRQSVDEKDDIWSLGCIILELARCCFNEKEYYICKGSSRRKPEVDWSQGNHTFRHYEYFHYFSQLLADGYVPCVTDAIPIDFANIIRGCLTVHTAERPTAEQLVHKLVSVEEETYGSVSKYCSSVNDFVSENIVSDQNLYRPINETLGCACSFDYKYPGDYIGQGGFGTVYKANITEFSDYTGSGVVAVKEVFLDASEVRRMRKEEMWHVAKDRWRSLLKLKHPNLVGYHKITIRRLLRGMAVDFMMDYCAAVGRKRQSGTDNETWQPFYSWSTYSGGDLSSFLVQQKLACAHATDPLLQMSMELAARFAVQITSGLLAIHQNGFVHGDLKPSNILMQVGADGRWTLLVGDLDGIIRVQENSANLVGRLGIGGTIPYMSPEMVAMAFQEEHADANIGFHVDVWSLGCVILDLVDCCFGVDERWFCKYTSDAKNETVADKIQRKDFPAHAFLFKLEQGYVPFVDPAIPPNLAAIVANCLEPASSKRSTAKEILKQLGRCKTKLKRGYRRNANKQFRCLLS